jgi:PAS domain S-box-containing protein
MFLSKEASSVLALALEIRNNLQTLTEQYDRLLVEIPTYADMPAAERQEAARNAILIIAAGLESGDPDLFTQFVRGVALERAAQGIDVAAVQRALNCLVEVVEPLFPDVQTANFLWRVMIQVNSALSGMIMEQRQIAEERFRRMADTIQDGITILEGQEVVYVNDRLSEIMGYSKEELKRMSSLDFAAPEEKERLQALVQELRQKNEALEELEYWIVRPDGERRYIRNRYSMSREGGRITGRIVFTTDLTESKRAEEALRQETMLLQALLNTTNDSLYFKDRQARLMRVNRKMLNDLNLEESQIVGKTDVELFGEEFGRKTLAEDLHIMETGEPVVGLLERRDLEDGQVHWTSTTKMPLRDAEGHIVGLAGITREINDIMATERALRESEEMFRSVVEHSLAGIFIVDDQFRFVYTNDQLLEIVGYSREEVIGQNFQAFLDDESRQLVADYYARRQRGEPIPSLYELDIVPKDGATRRVEVSSAAIQDAAGNVRTLAQLTDVTERRRMEKQLEELLARRAQQVRTSTEISQEIATAPALKELYQQVVRLIKERFGYYHAQIFRYEPGLDAVVLVASYGEPGQALLDEGHRLARGRGVVGTAAATARPVLASDVRKNPDWIPNPHLPRTRGELAVPIRWRDQMLGILDVQSDRASALTEEDQILLEGLCGQIAAAIESTRLRQEAEDSLSEMERLYRTLSREGWQEYRRQAEESAYYFDMTGIRAAQELRLPEIGPTVERRRFTPAEADEHPAVVAPLAVRSEVFGALGIQEDPENPLSDDDLALVEAISEQVAQALESARLFDEEQRARGLLDIRVHELDCLNDIGRLIDQTPAVPEFLTWLAGRVPRAMQHADLCLVAIELEGQVYGQPKALTLPTQMVQALRIAGEPRGKVSIAYTEPREFLNEESALLGDITRRVAGYIENQRLLHQMQIRAERERLTRTITDHIRRGVDREAIMRVAVRELSGMLGASKAVIRLGTPEQLLADRDHSIQDTL